MRVALLLAAACLAAYAQSISKPAQPGHFLESVGRRAALLGREDGTFEAWLNPVKLVRDFRLSVFFDGSLTPVDGSRMAFTTLLNGSYALFHRALDSPDAVLVPGLTGESKAPFVSPDGSWVAAFNGGKLRKAAVAGGAAEIVCDAPSGHGGAWSRQGLIVFSASHTSGLSVVSERGGPVKALTTPRFDEGESGHFWPQFLPDDRSVLFTATRTGGATYDSARIEAVRVDTGERTVLVERGYAARYLATGYLLYTLRGVQMLARFDARALKVTGPATQVLGGIRIDPLGPPDFDLSPGGVLAFVPGRPFVPESRLALVDRSGKAEDLEGINEPLADGPEFSPDGDRIAFVAGVEQTDIWIYDAKRRVVSRITQDGANTAPAWSPDGRRVAYVSKKDGTSIVFVANADGSGAPAAIVRRKNSIYNVVFRSDGQAIAFSEYDPRTLFDIWTAPLDGGAPQPLLATPAFEWQPAFSPDGRSIAYIAGGSGQESVHIQSLVTGRKWSVPGGPGNSPAWSRNGRELFFVSGRSLYVVDVASGDDPQPGTPRAVIPTFGPSVNVVQRSFSVAPDGKRFVMVKPVSSQPAATHFEVAVNWRP